MHYSEIDAICASPPSSLPLLRLVDGLASVGVDDYTLSSLCILLKFRVGGTH